MSTLISLKFACFTFKKQNKTRQEKQNKTEQKMKGNKTYPDISD